MDTAKQIFSHGWLGNSVSVFTQGYHPRDAFVADGLVAAQWSGFVPGATLSVFVPGVTVSVYVPGSTITVEV